MKVKFEYQLINNGNEYAVIGLSDSDDGIVSIPKSVKGIPVTTVNVSSYYGNKINLLKISDNINNIICNALISADTMIEVSKKNPYFCVDNGCLFDANYKTLYVAFDLKEEFYELPLTVEEIKDFAFMNNRSLVGVVLPETMRKIGRGVFKNCDNLLEVVGGENIEYIGQNAFDNTKFLKTHCNELIIGKVLLKYLKEDKKIVIPSNIVYIVSDAFSADKESENDTLETVCFSDSVQELGFGLFRNYKKIKRVVLGNNLHSIPSFCFDGCESLETVVFPKRLKAIEAYAFKGCKALKNIILPETLESIGNGAFRFCQNIEHISILKNIAYIGVDAFAGTTITEYDVADDNEQYTSKNGVLYTKSLCELVATPAIFKANEFHIPCETKILKENSFEGAHIESLYFDSQIENIEPHVFENAYIKSVYFSKLVTNIPANIFLNHRYLKHVEFSEGLETIGENSFYCCGLSDVCLPDSLVSIHDRAFALNPMKKAYVPPRVKEIGVAVFANVDQITVYDSIEDIHTYPNKKSAYGGNGARLGWIGLNSKPQYTTWPGGPNAVWKDYKLIVRSSQDNEIKFVLWMCGENESIEVKCRLVYSWSENAKFPLALIDQMFDEYKDFKGKVRTAILRLRYPVDLDKNAEEKYTKYLSRMKGKIKSDFIECADDEEISYLEEIKIL